jgi:hypothetical protein
MCFFCSEIQLKTPNWLFGQKKYEESGSASKAVKSEIENGVSCKESDVDGYSELNLLSSVDDNNEEDIFRRYILYIVSPFLRENTLLVTLFPAMQCFPSWLDMSQSLALLMAYD